MGGKAVGNFYTNFVKTFSHNVDPGFTLQYGGVGIEKQGY